MAELYSFEHITNGFYQEDQPTVFTNLASALTNKPLLLPI